MNKIETNKQGTKAQKIKETKNWFFDKGNNFNQTLFKLIKRYI